MSAEFDRVMSALANARAAFKNIDAVLSDNEWEDEPTRVDVLAALPMDDLMRLPREAA